MRAQDSEIGKKYLTKTGISVEVVQKLPHQVVVKSDETGRDIAIPLEYELKEKKMNEEVMTPTEVSVKKVKKSNVVDEGLKTNLTTDEIVRKVLEVFPGTEEKSIRNLVSVRRSKMKKV